MPDDFMKQLQLSKQIEQKAKEAALNRKAAEEKMAEAEAELAKVRDKVGSVEEADEFLKKANDAFRDKDYKSCQALAEDSIKATRAKMVNWVEQRFGSTRQVLSMLQENGIQVAPVSSLLQKISESLGKGDIDAAMASSSEAAEKAAELAKSSITTLITEGKREAEVLRSHSVDVTKESASMVAADGFLASSDYLSAMKEATASIGSLREKFRSDFMARVDQVKKRMDLWPGKGLDEVQAALNLAIKRMEAHEVDEALRSLGTVEANINRSISEEIKRHLDALSSRTATVGQMGMFTREATRAIENAKKVLVDGDLDSAVVAAKAADSQVRDLEAEAVAKEILKSKVKLQIARAVGADISTMSSELDAARGAVWKGDVTSAVRSVARARDALEQSISGYQDPVGRLVEFKQALTKAEALGLNVSEAVRASTIARRTILQRDFAGSAALLRDAAKDVQGSIHAFYGKQVIMIEMGLATALRMQGDVSLESEGLDQVVVKIKANEYNVVEEELKRLSEGVELIIRDLAERAVEESRTIIDEYEGPTDRSGPTAKLAEADIAIAESKFPEAYDLAVEAISLLKREESDLIESKFSQAERLLAIMAELECDSKMLRSKLARARELNASSDLSGAVRLTEEVVHYANDIIKDVVQKEMVKVKRAISISKKKGVAVLDAERTMKEAFDLLEQDKIEAAHAKMQDGMDKLKEVNRQHHDAYDLIADVRGLINEAFAKGVDVNKTEARLEGAQSMFETGRYKESMDIARMALHDIERQAAPHILPRMISEAREVFSLGRKMRVDTIRAENQLEGADQLIRNGEHAKALNVVKEAKDQVTALMNDALTRDIAAARATLEKSAVAGRNTSSVELMIEKADGQLGDRQYNDAWRIIELVKSELDQTTFMDARASDYVHQAEEGLKDLDELGMDSSASQEVLRQARLFQKQGNLTLATELAKKSFLIGAETAERVVADRVGHIDGDAKLNGLASPEMSNVMELRERIKGAVATHHFKEAMSLLPPYERAVHDVVRNRQRALDTLAFAESKVPGRRFDTLPEHLREMLSKARLSLEEGSFTDSRATSERFMQDLASIESMKDSRAKEVLSIREDLAFISDDKRRREISDMVDAAEGFLAKMDLERTSLHLRRARASLLEATGSEVGKCFEDLMLLQKIMDQMGIPRPKQEAQNGHSMKMYDIRPKDLEKLRGDIATFIIAATEGFNSRLDAVKAKVNEAGRQGRPVTASMALIEKASAAISGERFPDAMEAMADAERFIGVPDDALARFNAGKEELESILAKMREDSIQVDDLAQRLKALEKSLPDGHDGAITGLISLGASISERIEGMRPLLEIGLEFVDAPKKGEWGKALIKVRNSGGSRAKKVKVSLGDELEARGITPIEVLHAGESEVMRVELMPTLSGKKRASVFVKFESDIDGKDGSSEARIDLNAK